MKFLSALLDRETGAKARAALVALLGVVSALSFFLQSVLDVLHVLPSTGATATVGSIILAVIAYLGRFRDFGNKVVD